MIAPLSPVTSHKHASTHNLSVSQTRFIAAFPFSPPSPLTAQVDSEQVNSALGLGVSIDRDCSVKSAGGFLVQILPFCSEETLEILEKNLTGLPSVTNMLNAGMTTEDITNKCVL